MSEEDKDLEYLRLKKMEDILTYHPKPKPPTQVVTIGSADQLFKMIRDFPDYLTILEFFADWCVPCKQFRPVYERMPAQYAKKKILFNRINSDEFPEISKYYNVIGVPNMLFLKNSKVLHRQAGAMTRASLQNLLDAALVRFIGDIEDE